MTARIEVLGAKVTMPDSNFAETTGRTRSQSILEENAGSETIPGARTPRSNVAAPVHNKKANPTPYSPPPALDATWYTAQELDSYPRAATPVRFEAAAFTGTGDVEVRLLLWLRIDEHGEVVEVSAGAPGIPVRWVEAARTSLAAARFVPARKDERAVKSRLLLSVSFAPAAGRGPPRD